MYANILKVCEYCNKEFYGSKLRKYCSLECSHKSKQRKTNFICKYCGRDFTRQNWNSDAKYCSYNCKYLANTKDKIEIKCSNCGKLFLRKPFNINKEHNFCCKKCSEEFNRGSNHYEYKEFLHDKNIKLALKQWSAKIKERDNYVCQKCGETNSDILEAHHIKCRSKNISEQFDFNNGITLCLRCHMKEHITDEKSYRLIKYKYDKYVKEKMDSGSN